MLYNSDRAETQTPVETEGKWVGHNNKINEEGVQSLGCDKNWMELAETSWMQGGTENSLVTDF